MFLSPNGAIGDHLYRQNLVVSNSEVNTINERSHSDPQYYLVSEGSEDPHDESVEKRK